MYICILHSALSDDPASKLSHADLHTTGTHSLSFSLTLRAVLLDISHFPRGRLRNFAHGKAGCDFSLESRISNAAVAWNIL